MPYPELWHSVAIEALATLVIAMLTGIATYAYRMWQVPKYQAQIVQELRELRLAIARLTEQMRAGAHTHAGDIDVS